jgi:NADP-dependent 3-hydroxy acid dehydrogenase YdfG
VTIKGSNFDWRTCAGQSIAPTRIDIRKTILEYTEKDLDRVVTLNLKGTFYFFQAFGRLVIEQGAGSIIACSSVRAVTIDPGLAVMVARRRRSASWSRALRRRLAALASASMRLRRASSRRR